MIQFSALLRYSLYCINPISMEPCANLYEVQMLECCSHCRDGAYLVVHFEQFTEVSNNCFTNKTPKVICNQNSKYDIM